MNPHVCFQVSLLIKSTSAGWLRTGKLFGAQMCFHVHVKTQLPSVSLVALIESAFERFLLYVSLQVIIKMSLCHESLVTAGDRAGKRSIGSLEKVIGILETYVYPFMLYQELDSQEALPTLFIVALVFLVSDGILDYAVSLDTRVK